MWFEMHKHSQYSMFDGFDKVKNIVGYAKELLAGAELKAKN